MESPILTFRRAATHFLVILLIAPTTARAQQGGPAGPLPPLPNDPGSAAPSASPVSPSPPAARASSPVDDVAPDPGIQEPLPRPPPVEYVEPPVPTHAPKFSLYAGLNLSIVGFGNYFYDNETTGNFVTTGPAVEADVGARLGKRYIPYLFIEHGFLGKGHRFEGTDATAASDLMGIGFRYMAGDVDSAAFLTEISIGLRTITVKNNGETYKMRAFETFRLGLGAEIRIATLFAISPTARLSGGSMNDTEGDVTFGAEGSKDGQTHPAFRSGNNIDLPRGYLVVGIGCGGHFDIFGK